MWCAVETAADTLAHGDASVRLRAVHALTQAAGAYAKLLETCEFEGRLQKVEAALGIED